MAHKMNLHTNKPPIKSALSNKKVNTKGIKKKLEGPFFKGAQSQWMKYSFRKIKNKPLNSLLIPGTHNSFAKSLKSEKSPKKAKINKIFKGYPKKLIRLILSQWKETQTNGPVEQLMDGVRYFDLKICQDSSEFSKIRKLKICNSLYAGILEKSLQGLANFVKFVGKKEVLIINFREFTSVDEKSHQYLFNTLQSKFGKLLADSNKLSPKSKFKDFIRLNQRVIILYGNSDTVSNSKGLLWSSDVIRSPSFKVQDSISLYSKIKAQLAERSKTDEKLFITPAFITPNIQMIIKGLLSQPTCLQQQSSQVNPTIVNWISSNNLPISKMNVILLNHESKHLLSALIVKNLEH
ncbi:predicted protein [Naegleria gruberi]|uniref:Predicted protein n=1 Tax=Naegleria gruberi TaxID=5762 RepID=D2V689_NAEGR|nr:uncharacterized protein NAEGRDRAFT_57267 [Naegleria gruberi]EFC47794.1 predicted protein [Naegleria gruberi]|eukprot:XP_002680538.1 predicted protein [Naegleria gruberi strain NEG-M]